MIYKSEIYEVIHQSATEKFEIGAISEARMREYEEMCLVTETEAALQPDASETEKLSVPLLSGT